jgi:hypothetical protein
MVVAAALGVIAYLRSAGASLTKALFRIGYDLIEAKRGESKLAHGEFIEMVENDLPFGRRTAQRFMAIARDLRLRKATTSSLLPPYWYTLYTITRLGDETLPAPFRG